MSGWLDDSSGKEHTATPVSVGGGSVPAFSTSTKKFGSSSAYFNRAGNTTGGVIRIPSSNDFDLSNTWSINFWVYCQRTAAYYLGFFSNWDNNDGMNLYTRDDNFRINGKFQTSGGTATTHTLTTPTNNAWTHIAVSRNQSAGWWRVWKNGTQIYNHDLSGAWGGTHFNSSNPFHIGSMNGTSYVMNGFIDAFHIEDGVSNWSGSFSVPTEAPIATAYSVLLMQFNERFYEIQGTLTHDARLTIVDFDTRTIEYDADVSAGAYAIDVDDNTPKLIVAERLSNGKSISYGQVIPVLV